MASEKKKRKLKNSNLCRSGLKNKGSRLKRVQFYTPSDRQVNKHGGYRPGAGAKKKTEEEKKEPTKVMRVPISKVDQVKQVIDS